MKPDPVADVTREETDAQMPLLKEAYRKCMASPQQQKDQDYIRFFSNLLGPGKSNPMGIPNPTGPAVFKLTRHWIWPGGMPNGVGAVPSTFSVDGSKLWAYCNEVYSQEPNMTNENRPDVIICVDTDTMKTEMIGLVIKCENQLWFIREQELEALK